MPFLVASIFRVFWPGSRLQVADLALKDAVIGRRNHLLAATRRRQGVLRHWASPREQRWLGTTPWRATKPSVIHD